MSGKKCGSDISCGTFKVIAIRAPDVGKRELMEIFFRFPLLQNYTVKLN